MRIYAKTLINYVTLLVIRNTDMYVDDTQFTRLLCRVRFSANGAHQNPCSQQPVVLSTFLQTDLNQESAVHGERYRRVGLSGEIISTITLAQTRASLAPDADDGEMHVLTRSPKHRRSTD